MKLLRYLLSLFFPMTFVSPTDARSLTLVGTTADDPGSTTDEPNLNDDNTGTTASAEIRAGMSAYKIIHSLGFAFADLDNSNFSIRVFDGSMMSVTDMVEILPYTDANSVDAGESIRLVINDNGAYDTLLLPSSFVDALGDLGSDQIAIRLACPNSTGRGRFNEIQIEFFESAGGVITGDIDVTAQAAAYSSAGDRIVHGDADVTADAPTYSSAGDRIVHGDADVTAAAPVFAGVGDVAIEGDADVTADAAAFAGAGDRIVHGDADVTADAPVFASSGVLIRHGTADVSSDSASTAIAGEHGQVGSADVSAQAAAFAASGDVESPAIEGDADVSADPASFSAAGDRIVHGDADVIADDAASAMVGDRIVHGDADVTAQVPVFAGVGEVESPAIEGDADVTADAAAFAGAGDVAIEGDADVSADAPVYDSAGTVISSVNTGDADVVADPAVFAAAGERIVHGDIAVTAEVGIFASNGQRIVHGTADVTAATPVFAASGDVAIEGALAVTAQVGIFAAAGDRIVHGSTDVAAQQAAYASAGILGRVGTADVLAQVAQFLATANIVSPGLVTGELAAVSADASAAFTGIFVHTAALGAVSQDVLPFAAGVVGGKKIDGEDSKVLSKNFGAMLLYNDGLGSWLTLHDDSRGPTTKTISADYSFIPSDAGRTLEYTGAGGHEWTIDTDILDSTRIVLIRNVGGGNLTILRGVGMVLFLHDGTQSPTDGDWIIPQGAVASVQGDDPTTTFIWGQQLSTAAPAKIAMLMAAAQAAAFAADGEHGLSATLTATSPAAAFAGAGDNDIIHGPLAAVSAAASTAMAGEVTVPLVNLGGHNIQNFGFPSPQKSGVRCNSNGSLSRRDIDVFSVLDDPDWLDPPDSAPSNYQFRATRTGDPLGSGSSPENTWINASANPQWFIFSAGGFFSCVLTVSVRKGTGPVLDTGVYNLSAEVIV